MTEPQEYTACVTTVNKNACECPLLFI